MIAHRQPPETDDTIVLRARGLSKSFGGNAILRGVDLELREGEVFLLQGENGSGKTTLLNILTGNLEPDEGSLELTVGGRSEQFAFPRSWWHDLDMTDHFTPERVAVEGIGRSWQDVRLFRTQSLADNLAVAARGQSGENPLWALLRPFEVQRAESAVQLTATALLERLGLGERRDSYADQISLGQTKRVSIARAVNAGARVLFLDEPLAGLDAEGAAQVIRLLEDLVRTERLTLVIVEHVFHIPRFLKIATGVWTLRDGTVAVNTAADLAEPTVAVRDAVQWSAELADAEPVTHELGAGAHLSVVLPRGRSRGKLILQVNDLVVRRGQRVVIGHDGKGLSFRLHQGEIAVLQAPNGWGKTTLLHALAGLIPIERGTVWLDGQTVQTAPAWIRARRGLSLLQSQDQVFPSLTVAESLRLAGVADDDPLAKRKISELSGGERQRVSLRMACPPDKACLLLDEPFSMLDRAGVRTAQDFLLQHKLAAILIAIPGTL